MSSWSEIDWTAEAVSPISAPEPLPFTTTGKSLEIELYIGSGVSIDWFDGLRAL
jgi:hypothetical protein